MFVRHIKDWVTKTAARSGTESKLSKEELKSFAVISLGARVVVLTTILGVATWRVVDNSTSQVGFILLALVFGVSAIQAVGLRSFGGSKINSIIQIASDWLLASAVFGYSQSSIATFLYILVIAEAAGAWRLRVGLLVGTICSVSYSLIQGGVIPFFDDIPGVRTSEILLIHFSFLIAAVFSSFIATHLRSLKDVSDSQNAAINQLKEKQHQLLGELTRVRELEEKLSYHEQVSQLLLEKDNNVASIFNVSIIGEGAMMRTLLNLVKKVAPSDASVLVTGESGTGKELIAKAIHELSPRSRKNFVAINCGAIPENLIESELFGHKKGSFTGAISDNGGLFRKANGGTIFLDEIGELPPQMQTKLLRALQDRNIRPVGDVNDIPIDVRVIAATNRDLKKEIGRGAFREDLFYRLNVVNLVVPPLRERREDLPLLIRHFLTKYCQPDQVIPQISPEALQALKEYPFPGNIRELENLIERAIVLGGQAILPEHLPEEVKKKSHGTSSLPSLSNGETQIIELPLDLDSVLNEFERQMIFKALEQTNGAKKQAAELLGMNFRSFRYRIKKYGLSEEP
jgi:two-component system response regulator PilR (NtrC family)